jgi:hypothetical protein
MRFRLSPHAQSSFVGDLKKALEKATLTPWQLDVEHEGGAPSLLESKQHEKQQEQENALKDPLVQKILERFPNTHVTFS